MNITPVSTYIPQITARENIEGTPLKISGNQPTFLDVFTQIFGEARLTTEIQGEDRIRMMLGEADDLEQIQLNIQKAEIAVELLATVRNTVLESYNEIVRMQI